MNPPTNIIFTGVGGQGNVLAAKLVAAALLDAGQEVAVGDVFGLSQRGGSVASHVRYWQGGPVPPLISRGHVDVVVGFEPLEALRILCEFGNAGHARAGQRHRHPPGGRAHGAGGVSPAGTDAGPDARVGP